MSIEHVSGQVGDLTEEQSQKLELVRPQMCQPFLLIEALQFRTAIEDTLRPEFDDYFLLRWLRARKFDVVAAELMLRRVCDRENR